ncbi:hypothetical protein HK104_010188 [Borealophlyctis nickersoniae]|nr:hypothetical protein HK104_010188 [Borealophlyctis nickersoniae]
MAPFRQLLKKMTRFKASSKEAKVILTGFEAPSKEAQVILPTDKLRPILSLFSFVALIHARAASRLFKAEADLILKDKYGWKPGQRVGPGTPSMNEESRILLNIYVED